VKSNAIDWHCARRPRMEAIPLFTRIYSVAPSKKEMGKKDGDEAIKRYQLALQLAPDGYADRRLYLKNTGMTLLARRGEGDVSAAVDYLKKATESTEECHKEFASLVNEPGIALQWQNGQDDDQSIDCFRKALASSTDEDKDRVVFYCNLGNSLYAKNHCHPSELYLSIDPRMCLNQL
jgi:tetratricopeptide (TPR) repeat protein